MHTAVDLRRHRPGGEPPEGFLEEVCCSENLHVGLEEWEPQKDLFHFCLGIATLGSWKGSILFFFNFFATLLHIEFTG